MLTSDEGAEMRLEFLWPQPKPRLRPDQPCGHRGCLHHRTHPCEGCGRIAGHYPEESEAVDVASD
jgi:hypothetical protein